MSFVSRMFSPLLRSNIFRNVSESAFSKKSYLYLYSTIASMLIVNRTTAHASSGSIAAAGAQCFSFGVSHMQGRRSYMEDVTSVIPSFMGLQSLFAGVFDGHSGKRASVFAADLLPKTLSKLLMDNGLASVDPVEQEQRFLDIVARCMREAVLLTDKSFCKLATMQQWTDGTTAVAAFIHSGHMFLSNTGDSRAVLCSKSQGAFPLTRDHKPDDPAEAERISSVGGFVKFSSGAYRVNGILAMSRAVGDCFLKAVGVTAEPDLYHRKLRTDDEFLIIASDGLWDVLSSDTVHKVASENDASPQLAAERLVELAYRNGSMDNISVVVVDLRNLSEGHSSTASVLER
ncbi:mitochondrial putative pyruvate dehydrogenase phosphatase (PDP) [Andalucia godoyi]|uniref:Mitochondrial putative pyruvate dehydrogenase phosphatase (PDP) n=1 Tax=Andalucia godoyi TaxID=505711 RepID=A0A8K0F165_ANDGO|nr:mitochondrial putative pyruvate dehydrogenase phosphatase (PDP) [Andalucia godoyi]|eukprot:ANDGO_04939.mRNA.1 mitochondrial putative pyruvate dehydrogenase phosphatase (PDP)